MLVKRLLGLPFQRSQLDRSPAAHQRVLGPLYDPASPPWPIQRDMVDMRLFSRADALGFVPGRDDPLRPAARKLADKIKALKGASDVLAFIAVSGSGKTSCAFASKSGGGGEDLRTNA